MWSRKVLTLILVRELGTLAGNFSSLTKLCFPYVNHTKNGFQILLHQLLENGIAIIVYKYCYRIWYASWVQILMA